MRRVLEESKRMPMVYESSVTENEYGAEEVGDSGTVNMGVVQRAGNKKLEKIKEVLLKKMCEDPEEAHIMLSEEDGQSKYMCFIDGGIIFKSRVLGRFVKADEYFGEPTIAHPQLTSKVYKRDPFTGKFEASVELDYGANPHLCREGKFEKIMFSFKKVLQEKGPPRKRTPLPTPEDFSCSSDEDNLGSQRNQIFYDTNEALNKESPKRKDEDKDPLLQLLSLDSDEE